MRSNAIAAAMMAAVLVGCGGGEKSEYNYAIQARSQAAAEKRIAFEADVARLQAEPTPPTLTVARHTTAKSWVEVPVFYGTKRNVTGLNAPEKYYGDGDDTLKYGVATVTIPEHYRPGHEDTRGLCRFFGRLGCQKGPSNSVTLSTLEPTDAAQWLTRIGGEVAGDSVDALVFVHGYNTSFTDAVERTAELSYAIGFRGVATTYDWASRNAVPAYVIDQETAERSAPDFRRFLRRLVDSTHVRHVAIIAHSMGTRLVSYALRDFGNEVTSLRIGPIIYAASDVDSAIFVDQLAGIVARAGHPVTLYASSKDRAILASDRIVHGAPRVGSGPPSIIAVPGVDYIDASNEDTDLLGHGYYAEDRAVVDDIMLVVNYGFGAAERTDLDDVPDGKLSYYRLR